jgi:hypothetical protein
METSSATSSRSGFLNLFVKDFQSLGLVQLKWKIIGCWRKKEDRLWRILSDILAPSKARGAAGSSKTRGATGLVDTLFKEPMGMPSADFSLQPPSQMMSIKKDHWFWLEEFQGFPEDSALSARIRKNHQLKKEGTNFEGPMRCYRFITHWQRGRIGKVSRRRNRLN